MECGEKEKPPDPPPASVGMQVDLDQSTNRKRAAASRNLFKDDENLDTKKKILNLDEVSASIAFTYKHPSLESDVRSYGKDDNGPYIVHVSRIEESANLGLSLRPIKVGLIFMQNQVQDIKKDGIKSLGRNKVSVEFKSAVGANNFMALTFLAHHKLTASIPSYNVSRMGIVRGVPVDWSMQEFVEATENNQGNGRILKARRLQRKIFKDDGTPTWIPTQTVVLTFEGQTLPERIYAFYTSLVVEIYQLPTIQCRKCLRFGHIQKQCRSDARCYRCCKKHPGDECHVAPENATCLLCSGRHFATDKICPEFSRQKAIKLVMSEQSISYAEASARFPSVRRSFADVAKVMFSPVSDHRSNTLSASISSTPLRVNTPSKSASYRKTVLRTPREKPHLSEGYDRVHHQNIVASPSSQLPNGCALNGSNQISTRITPNEDIFELAFKLITNIVAKWSDILPKNVAPALIAAAKSLSTLNGSFSFPDSIPSMEL